MLLTDGFGVLYYNGLINYFNQKINRCFKPLPFSRVKSLKENDKIWIEIPNVAEQKAIGYIFVSIQSITKIEGLLRIVWKGLKSSGELLVVCRESNDTNLYCLCKPEKLEGILNDESHAIIWQ